MPNCSKITISCLQVIPLVEVTVEKALGQLLTGSETRPVSLEIENKVENEKKIPPLAYYISLFEHICKL